jgi:hypothetical protein
MPWCVPWHAKTSRRRTKFFLACAIFPKCVSKFIIRHLEGLQSFKCKVCFGALLGAMAHHDLPWCVPWHANRRRTNFCFAHAICPKCVYNLIIRHLEGIPSFKSKVRSGALVGAMACLGGCHGMQKRVDAAKFFFLARAICSKCVYKFIIRYLKGVPCLKSKVCSRAWVGAMACLNVCHGMPKQVDAAQIFVLPVTFS